MASSGSSTSMASSGSSTSTASSASTEGALGAPASVSEMAGTSSSMSPSGTRISRELSVDARPFYPTRGSSSSMTAVPAASVSFSVTAKPFYPTRGSSSSMTIMPSVVRRVWASSWTNWSTSTSSDTTFGHGQADLPPPWTTASSFFTSHTSGPAAAEVWAIHPVSSLEDPEHLAAELDSLGVQEVKEESMGSEVPIKDQSQQPPGAGQDDQLGKGKQSVGVGQDDQLGNVKQPMVLEQDRVRRPLVILGKIPPAPEEICHTIQFGSFRPPPPKNHEKEGMQQLLAQCNPEVEHMVDQSQNPKSDVDPEQIGDSSLPSFGPSIQPYL